MNNFLFCHLYTIGGIVYKFAEVMKMLVLNQELKELSCCSTQEERKSQHNDKGKLISRLNRIEGQIRGVKGLNERDVYFDDVLNQISAVQSALNSVGKMLLEELYRQEDSIG